jgi:MFS family permease
MIAAAPRLYTLPFGLLCLSQMLFASSFTMILPELPSYLSSLGGEDFKGLIIALFTLTAGLSRPFSGKLSDTVGRVPIMIFGTLVCVVCSLLYPLISSVLGFLLLRFFHGLSTGFKPTASTAYVADIAPPARRGEALGILSMSMNMGGALAPAFGSWLAQATSLNTMFMVSSGVALLSIAILVGLRETLSKKEPFHPRLLILSRKEVIEPSALDPAVVTALVYLGYGALLTVIPDQSEYFGLRNKGWFFFHFHAVFAGIALRLGQDVGPLRTGAGPQDRDVSGGHFHGLDGRCSIRRRTLDRLGGPGFCARGGRARPVCLGHRP